MGGALSATARHALSIPTLAALLVARVLLMVTPFLLAAGVVYWLFLTEFDINYYLTERPMPFWVAGILIAGLAMAMSAVVIPRLVGWAHALPLQLFENVGALKALGASEERARGHRPAISVILVGKPSVFLNTPFAEGAAAFSPDGRWLAYQSNESGTYEIYVRPFPGPGGKWQVSTRGGAFPIWSRNGKELFYWSGEQIWVASYTGQEGSFRAEKPRVWSPGRVAWRAGSAWFDPHPDGKRFAVVAAASEETEVRRDKVVFITNFFDELHRIAPPAKR